MLIIKDDTVATTSPLKDPPNTKERATSTSKSSTPSSYRLRSNFILTNIKFNPVTAPIISKKIISI